MGRKRYHPYLTIHQDDSGRHAHYYDHRLPTDHTRPQTRAECPVERPCGFVGCRYNLYLEVTDSGSIKLNFPKVAPWDMGASCALDLAEVGGLTLDEVGKALNVSRERIRQIETDALDSVCSCWPDFEGWLWR